MSSTWQTLKAKRERVVHGQEATMGRVIRADRRGRFAGFGQALPIMPGSQAAPLKILNPDGTVREVVSAAEFRRRHPLKKEDHDARG